MDDSKNPLSGMDIHQFSIEETDECSGFEKMSQQLAKLYGGQTELRRDHIKTTIEKYYRNEISFSVLSKSTFRGNSIEAYCFLISSEAELFRIPPASLNREEIKSDTTGIVIDIPTVMLLFQLDIEHELYTDKRYILPDTSFMILQTAYKEAEGKQNNYANMQITSKGISAGIVYDENYHQERMKFYDSIMNWVEKNCDVVSIPERIDELPELERDIVYDPYLLSILDNSLITKRENYILVASDTAYLNFPVFRTEKLYSIEALFKAFGTQADIEIIIEILLKKNIVGLTLSKEHLQKEFLNRASGGNNAYHTCMYNLEIGWNSATNITSAVEHVRWIAISSILAPHEKVRYIEEVFRAILPGVYPQKDVGQLLIDQIMEQFKFLPEFLGMINYCLHNVVQSFNQTKS